MRDSSVVAISFSADSLTQKSVVSISELEKLLFSRVMVCVVNSVALNAKKLSDSSGSIVFNYRIRAFFVVNTRYIDIIVKIRCFESRSCVFNYVTDNLSSISGIVPEMVRIDIRKVTISNGNVVGIEKFNRQQHRGFVRVALLS